MNIREIMNDNPVCCEPGTGLEDVAQMMVECHCGAIPVVEDVSTRQGLKGIVTDRDIVCRILADGRNPLEASAEDCMSTPVATVKPDDDVNRALELMKKYQVRRMPVVDDKGMCSGILTQAHLAKALSAEAIGEFVKTVSEYSEQPSKVPAGA